MAPRVVGRERVPLLVVRLRPDEVLPARIDERVDGALEPELRELDGFVVARTEAGPPEQALCLHGTEMSPVGGYPRHDWSPSSAAAARAGYPLTQGRLAREGDGGETGNAQNRSATPLLIASKVSFASSCVDFTLPYQDEPPAFDCPAAYARIWDTVRC